LIRELSVDGISSHLGVNHEEQQFGGRDHYQSVGIFLLYIP